jgi:hypothetical protein
MILTFFESHSWNVQATPRYLLSCAIHLASVCELMCVHVHEMINRINKRDSSSYGEEFEYGKQPHPILHTEKKP